jgi:hypothetical protein
MSAPVSGWREKSRAMLRFFFAAGALFRVSVVVDIG